MMNNKHIFPEGFFCMLYANITQVSETMTTTISDVPSNCEDPAIQISLYDKLHLRMISIMHDSLYGLFVNPDKLLTAAGIEPGQRVLEVGCGPGFFTIPAAKMIGTKGHLYSIDINPAAVSKVRQKVKHNGLGNVDVELADAAKVNIPDSSVDVVFLFGIIRSLKNLEPVLAEAYRVLNSAGAVAVQKSSWSEKKLLDTFAGTGLFRYLGKESRIYKFEKCTDQKD
jgi:ubiquinone/menaquinone biosynthesis C-methylase UbiE